MNQGRALRRHDGGFTLRAISMLIMAAPVACTDPDYDSQTGAGSDAGVGLQ